MYEEPKMEKLTINLPPIEIGRMDLVVEAGLYPNRTEFIRAAIRKTLDGHQDFIDKRLLEMETEIKEIEADAKQSDYTMKFFGMGVFRLGKKSFEKAMREGKKIHIQAIGLVILDESITPVLIEKTVEKIKVYGVLRASPKVKAALEKISKNED